jgi:hypothetical protein
MVGGLGRRETVLGPQTDVRRLSKRVAKWSALAGFGGQLGEFGMGMLQKYIVRLT